MGEHRGSSAEFAATLYVVATPIGNLRDITLRALDVLRSVALIAAEDTRMTRKLLNHYSISANLIALHEHNERSRTARIIAALASGQSVAVVSDAGTPALSDPGAFVVAQIRAAGYPVVAIPGASALIAAWSVSGCAAGRFLFYGFLPPAPGARRNELKRLRLLPYPLIFYEAPHRVAAMLDDLTAELGPARRVTIARELTKLFESVHSCLLSAAGDWLRADAQRQRGEFVVIVEGASPEPPALAPEAQHTLRVLMEEMQFAEAVKLAARITGEKRNALYKLALRLKTGDGD
jgi:16S rRNA (cytidine1402-2'-O)-methyltransferase